MAVYVVTGAAGFIGSHIAERLLREGHTVRVVDNLSTGSQDNLERLANLDAPTLKKVAKKVTVSPLNFV